MANTLLTIGQITKTALAIFRNSNAFIKSVDRQYDDQYARSGAKIGSTLRIRLPNDYFLRTGPTASVQSTTEFSVPLVVSTEVGVDISFSAADRAESIDDYTKRYIDPMVNVIAGGVATAVMGGAETIPHLVHNVDAVATNNTTSPQAATWLAAKAKLEQNSAAGEFMAVLDPLSGARTVGALAGFFNQQEELGRQYIKGEMRNALGFKFMTDNTVIIHQTAAFGSLPSVNGAGQTGNALVVTATVAPINKGDIITIAGVNAVNRVNKNDIGILRQFAVTAFVPVGSTVLPIYPAIVGQVAGANVAYQTVAQSPANGAALSSPINAGETYRKNIAFVPGAVTMVTVDYEIPGGVQEAYRDNLDGISMRMVTAYNILTNQTVTRADVLFGFQWVRPEWAVVVADAV